MRAAALTRHRLGITQMQMGALLGVKRIVVAMYENGRRSLPVPAIVKLAAIEKFLAADTGVLTSAHPVLQKQQLKAKTIADRFARDQAYKKAVAERALLIAQEAFNKKMLLLGLLEHLKQPAGKAGKDQELLPMNYLEAEALETIEQHGLDKQALLQLKISLYTGNRGDEPAFV